MERITLVGTVTGGTQYDVLLAVAGGREVETWKIGWKKGLPMPPQGAQIVARCTVFPKPWNDKIITTVYCVEWWPIAQQAAPQQQYGGAQQQPDPWQMGGGNDAPF